jgi:sugar-specific transcriptional regulator TrmB
MEQIHETLKLLGLSFPERKVYLSVLKEGSASARTLAMRTGITRTSMYDQLKELVQLGLIVERDIDGTTLFTATDIRIVETLLREREEKIAHSRKEVMSQLGALAHTEEGSTPRIRFVEGGEHIARVLYELLFVGGKEIQTVWPYKEMLEVMGEDFYQKFNRERVRKKIRLHAVWPMQTKKTETLWDSLDRGDTTVERRFAPKEFHPRMSYTICGNRVLCVSSTKEMFGFVVESAEFAELMRMQFEVLWEVGRPCRS